VDKLWKNKIKLIDKVTNESNIIDYNYAKSPSLYSEGLEDLRIVEFNNKLWFSAVYKNNNELYSTIIGFFNDSKNNIEKIVYDFKSDSNNNIKNIVPLVHDNLLHFIDTLNKIIYKLDNETLELSSDPLESTIDNLNIRGSTEFIKLNNNIYGGIVHNSINISKGYDINKYYYFHWIEIDMQPKTIIKLSKPFIFKNWGITFVSGIFLQKNTLHIYYSEHDKDIYDAVIDINLLRNNK